MFRNNPEEFLITITELINEQKATAIVDHISYDTIAGEYDNNIFTAEKSSQSFEKAFLAKKAIQDYVFTDGTATESVEKKFVKELDAAEEVCVYAISQLHLAITHQTGLSLSTKELLNTYFLLQKQKAR